MSADEEDLRRKLRESFIDATLDEINFIVKRWTRSPTWDTFIDRYFIDIGVYLRGMDISSLPQINPIRIKDTLYPPRAAGGVNPVVSPQRRYVELAVIRDRTGDYNHFHGSRSFQEVAWIYHDNNDSNPSSWFESTTRLDDADTARARFYDIGNSRDDATRNTRFPPSERTDGGKRKSRRTKKSRKSRSRKHYRKSRRLVK
jgi:hypothetical protein